jgi:hypothetical protein
MLEQLKVDSADPDWAPNSGLSRATTGGWGVTTAGCGRNFVQTHAHAA